MNLINLIYQTEKVVSELDQQIEVCYITDVDSAKLAGAKDLILSFLNDVKDSLPYKLEQAEYYGIPLEIDEDMDTDLIDEIKREFQALGLEELIGGGYK